MRRLRKRFGGCWGLRRRMTEGRLTAIHKGREFVAGCFGYYTLRAREKFYSA